MREFAASETMMIRQKVTVPLIFDAVKFNWAKQFGQDPLDPMAVEFMLSFATYLRNCTHASQTTLNYCSVYCVCCLSGRTFIDNCKPRAKPQHSCPLRPSISDFVCNVPALSANRPFNRIWNSGVLKCYKPSRTLHLGHVVVLKLDWEDD